MSAQERNKRYYIANRERLIEQSGERQKINSALKRFAEWDEANKAALKAANKAGFERVTTEAINRLGIDRVEFVHGFQKFIMSKVITENTTMPALYKDKALWSLFMRFLVKLDAFQEERIQKALSREIEDAGMTRAQRIARSQAVIDSYKK
ncbi:hypothetical protein [Aeromonas sp. 604534]|uniref:hypothetical protein n=1 Tax=Aeromonas sp. 604534 TaxID=2712055 RepID=UPI003BA1C028